MADRDVNEVEVAEAEHSREVEEEKEDETFLHGEEINKNFDENDVIILNDKAWHYGKVVHWRHTYGFLEDEKNEEKYFVHATSIETSDRHVFLRKGMQTRFKVGIHQKSGNKRAFEVQARHGGKLTFFEKQGETDHWSRCIVEPSMRFEGVVNRYFFKKGFGWIRPDKVFRRHPFPDVLTAAQKFECTQTFKLYVAREDVESHDFPPALRQGQRVTFQLYKDGKGLGACHVADEGGRLFKDTYETQPQGQGRYTGRVKKIKVHGYLFIKPEPPIVGVNGLRPHGDIHALCESIDTCLRPARVASGSRVTFSLMRDTNGYHAVDIRDENDESFDSCSPEEWEDAHRKPVDTEVYEGVVDSFRWGIGAGWIRPTCTLPTTFTHQLSNKGLIFFSRDDLSSNDKVFGVNSGIKVRFQIHVDTLDRSLVEHIETPRVVAVNITNAQGKPFEGLRRPEPLQKDRYRGHVAYFDKRRNMIYIKYQGNRYGVPIQKCMFEDPDLQHVSKGLKCEFSVEVQAQRKKLSNVVFKMVNSRKRDSRAPYGRDRNQMDFSEFHQQQHFYGGPAPPNLRQQPQEYIPYAGYYPQHGRINTSYFNNFHPNLQLQY